MSSKVVAAIAAAFAAGVFVAAAPNVLGHGPGADPDRGSMHADGPSDQMVGGCEPEEMVEHMSGAGGHMMGAGDGMPDMMNGAGGHMSGGDDWMTDMMFGAGAPR